MITDDLQNSANDENDKLREKKDQALMAEVKACIVSTGAAAEQTAKLFDTSVLPYYFTFSCISVL